MAYFTLHRDHRFISALGHSVQFRKNEPVYVPPALHKEVQAFGAEPVDAAEVESILGEEQEQKPEVAQEEIIASCWTPSKHCRSATRAAISPGKVSRRSRH